MYKNIIFFKIYEEILPLYKNLDSKKEILKKLRSIDIKKEIEILDSNKNKKRNLFIIETHDGGRFGTLSKKRPFNENSLSRLLYKEKESEVDTDNLLLEDFTYFYIRFSDFNISVISNKRAPDFDTTINLYFKDLFSNNYFSRLEVVRYASNMKEIENRLKNVSKLDFIVHSNEIDEYSVFSDFFNFSKNELEKVSSTINFKRKTVNIKKLKKKLGNKDINSFFNKINVTCKDDNDNQYVVDFLKEFITFNAKIENLDETLKSSSDLSKIKEALIISFNHLLWLWVKICYLK